VQLDLDPQYPPPRHLDVGPRCVGVHRRPPGLPAPQLRNRCPPSPCSRLSRPRTTTRTPPHPGVINRRCACPPPAWPTGGEGDPGMVPTFTADRSTSEVPSSYPQPRHAYSAGQQIHGTTRGWSSFSVGDCQVSGVSAACPAVGRAPWVDENGVPLADVDPVWCFELACKRDAGGLVGHPGVLLRARV
jgi:hypothetical protein